MSVPLNEPSIQTLRLRIFRASSTPNEVEGSAPAHFSNPNVIQVLPCCKIDPKLNLTSTGYRRRSDLRRSIRISIKSYFAVSTVTNNSYFVPIVPGTVLQMVKTTTVKPPHHRHTARVVEEKGAGRISFCQGDQSLRLWLISYTANVCYLPVEIECISAAKSLDALSIALSGRISCLPDN